MKKVLIATFSQSGATKKVAMQIAKGLSESGCEVTHFKIDEGSTPDLEAFDMIGIGTPTYFFRPPFIVMDFIDRLKGLENKSSFVFITHGTSRGDCGNWLRRKLNENGSRDLGYFCCFGADHWIGYIQRGVMFSPDSPDEVELSHAEKFGKKLVPRFESQNPEIEPFDPKTPPMYALERMLVARPFAKLLYSKTFRADSKCDNCGVCIKKCPVSNISEKENGKLRWQSKCILCATCELSCPKDAIHSAFDWVIFSPFMQYNIRHSKKKGIPFVKVAHSQGRTNDVFYN